MCRRILTRLRSTRFGSLVPIDDSTRMHRALAYVICVATVVHGGGQVRAVAPGVMLPADPARGAGRHSFQAANYVLYYTLEPGALGSTQV